MAIAKVDKITKLLVILNIIVFGYHILISKQAALFGTDDPVQSIMSGAMTKTTPYYTWLTSMFQHSSALHIIMNMIFLIAISYSIYYAYGQFYYLIGYLFSGLTGSFLIATMSDYNQITLGASGAICGLIGMNLMSACFDRSRRYQLQSAFITMVYMIIMTFIYPNVSGPGHIGGLIGGLIFGCIFYLFKFLFDMIKASKERSEH